MSQKETPYGFTGDIKVNDQISTETLRQMAQSPGVALNVTNLSDLSRLPPIVKASLFSEVERFVAPSLVEAAGGICIRDTIQESDYAKRVEVPNLKSGCITLQRYFYRPNGHPDSGSYIYAPLLEQGGVNTFPKDNIVAPKLASVTVISLPWARKIRSNIKYTGRPDFMDSHWHDVHVSPSRPVALQNQQRPFSHLMFAKD
ncbi:MAG: hypothetical protein WDO70_09770 [Alphaproteobacteria bacterium]